MPRQGSSTAGVAPAHRRWAAAGWREVDGIHRQAIASRRLCPLAEGQIVEALGHGVRERNIDAYAGTEYHVVRVSASDEDREQMVEFACHSIDEEYGYLTIVSIALSLLTGGTLIFGVAGQKICSGLVARALERAGFVFSFEPSHAMPADLARAFKVLAPPAGTDKGTPPSEAPPRAHRRRCGATD